MGPAEGKPRVALGAPTGGEEARAFLQKRLAQVGGVYLVLALVLFLAQAAARALIGGGPSASTRSSRRSAKAAWAPSTARATPCCAGPPR